MFKWLYSFEKESSGLLSEKKNEETKLRARDTVGGNITNSA